MTATAYYRKLEFCRNAETLWRKVETNWDLLGVKPDGQFVVGYPRRSEGFTMRAAPTVVKAGAKEGEHGVRLYMPREPGPSTDWYATPEQARAAYREAVEREQNLDAPGIVRVELVENSQPVARELITRRLPNYG
jgi:hypothetical protein